MTPLSYIIEEVRRQGHDLSDAQDGGKRVMWMLEAWLEAMSWTEKDYAPQWYHIEKLGKLIERDVNREGFRTCEVRVGTNKTVPASRVRKTLNMMLDAHRDAPYAPLDFYKEFELIHPFRDGNGRTGKILLNFINGTLKNPIFPPSDFWGREIQNP
jgi:hypothetical protein